MQVQLLRELFSPSDEVATFPSSFVAPALVGVREFWVRVEKAPNPTADRRRDERQKQDPNREEQDLRHHRDQESDEAENEEENGERQVPRLVAPDARFAGRRIRFFGCHAESTLRETRTPPRGEFADF